MHEQEIWHELLGLLQDWLGGCQEVRVLHGGLWLNSGPLRCDLQHQLHRRRWATSEGLGPPAGGQLHLGKCHNSWPGCGRRWLQLRDLRRPGGRLGLHRNLRGWLQHERGHASHLDVQLCRPVRGQADVCAGALHLQLAQRRRGVAQLQRSWYRQLVHRRLRRRLRPRFGDHQRKLRLQLGRQLQRLSPELCGPAVRNAAPERVLPERLRQHHHGQQLLR
mmetsp:Transcript_73651/g.118825  ORF Transcript_73651/g.118825 Transcript_73651/m.118825 type:complete len:220 (+) Transcript_73651:522-1181(+)